MRRFREIAALPFEIRTAKGSGCTVAQLREVFRPVCPTRKIHSFMSANLAGGGIAAGRRPEKLRAKNSLMVMTIFRRNSGSVGNLWRKPMAVLLIILQTRDRRGPYRGANAFLYAPKSHDVGARLASAALRHTRSGHEGARLNLETQKSQYKIRHDCNRQADTRQGSDRSSKLAALQMS
jgi:hypothetical protein